MSGSGEVLNQPHIELAQLLGSYNKNAWKKLGSYLVSFGKLKLFF